MNYFRGRYCILRDMEESDAPFVVAWRNRPKSGKWLNQPEPLTEEKHLCWLEGSREQGELSLVFAEPDGEPFGTCGIYNFDCRRASAEAGRLSGEGGSPYGLLEGLYLLHRVAFEKMGLKRISCSCAAKNRSAQRCYEHLGYIKEGLRRRHLLLADGYHDLLVFGLFPEEFAEARRDIEAVLYGENNIPEPLSDISEK